jgi:hypothetical protein
MFLSLQFGKHCIYSLVNMQIRIIVQPLGATVAELSPAAAQAYAAVHTFLLLRLQKTVAGRVILHTPSELTYRKHSYRGARCYLYRCLVLFFHISVLMSETGSRLPLRFRLLLSDLMLTQSHVNASSTCRSKLFFLIVVKHTVLLHTFSRSQ